VRGAHALGSSCSLLSTKVRGLCRGYFEAAGFRNITVVEAAAQFAPLGVGLNILPSAARELHALGILETLRSQSIETGALSLRNRWGTEIWTEARGLAAGYRWPQLSIQRKVLQQVLLDTLILRLGKHVLLENHELEFIDQEGVGGVVAHFGNGRSIGCDLLVAADGIHSRVRSGMYPAEGEPVASGMRMFRGTTWSKPFFDGKTMAVMGDARDRLVFYPIARHPEREEQCLINWVACAPVARSVRGQASWRRSVSSQIPVELFSEWHVPWLDIQETMHRSVEVYEYPLVDRDPIAKWYDGNALLIGDAAHPMYPNGSNGATQAIIDARELVSQLTRARYVHSGIVRFQGARIRKTTALQQSNRERGPEAVISLAHKRRPRGFSHVSEAFVEEELRTVSARYARTGGLDVPAVNGQPSYKCMVEGASS